MSNFVNAFCFGKLRYFTPLLGAEIHHPPTIDPLVKALNECLRAELDAFCSTPIPLLYAGTQRLQLTQMIQNDAAKLVLSSIVNQTILGEEYLTWNGTGDGWSPLGQPWQLFTQLHLEPDQLIKRFPLSNRVRDGLFKCNFQFNYNRETALTKHQNGLSR
jgi:hypothetical protein